jgi:hypothetical protein
VPVASAHQTRETPLTTGTRRAVALCTAFCASADSAAAARRTGFGPRAAQGTGTRLLALVPCGAWREATTTVAPWAAPVTPVAEQGAGAPAALPPRLPQRAPAVLQERLRPARATVHAGAPVGADGLWSACPRGSRAERTGGALPDRRHALLPGSGGSAATAGATRHAVWDAPRRVGGPGALPRAHARADGCRPGGGLRTTRQARALCLRLLAAPRLGAPGRRWGVCVPSPPASDDTLPHGCGPWAPAGPGLVARHRRGREDGARACPRSHRAGSLSSRGVSSARGHRQGQQAPRHTAGHAHRRSSLHSASRPVRLAPLAHPGAPDERAPGTTQERVSSPGASGTSRAVVAALASLRLSHDHTRHPTLLVSGRADAARGAQCCAWSTGACDVVGDATPGTERAHTRPACPGRGCWVDGRHRAVRVGPPPLAPTALSLCRTSGGHGATHTTPHGAHTPRAFGTTRRNRRIDGGCQGVASCICPRAGGPGAPQGCGATGSGGRLGAGDVARPARAGETPRGGARRAGALGCQARAGAGHGTADAWLPQPAARGMDTPPRGAGRRAPPAACPAEGHVAGRHGVGTRRRTPDVVVGVAARRHTSPR